MKYSLITTLAIVGGVYAYVQFGSLYPDDSGSHAKLNGQVVAVIDGDTFKLLVGSEIFLVHMVGIDAPEFGQRFGEYAEKYLADLVKTRTVTLEVHGTDHNGELIGELFLNNISINKLLISDGFAWAERNLLANPAWVGLEQLARDKGFGLWRDENAIPPWKFRDQLLDL